MYINIIILALYKSLYKPNCQYYIIYNLAITLLIKYITYKELYKITI